MTSDLFCENIFIILQNAADGVANATQPRWQWEAVLPNGEVSMMLNTDFEIFFDLGELKKSKDINLQPADKNCK